MKLILLLAVAVIATACATSHAARVAPAKAKPIAFKPSPAEIGDDQSRHVEAVSRTQWLRDLRAAARAAPDERFPSPGASVLSLRLADQAQAHDFTIVSVRLLHARQLAPLIVVRTSDGPALAHAMKSILFALDSDWSPRSDYEGLYFAAIDKKGVPLFLVSNVLWNPNHFEGSVWGRTEALYPLPHW
jgi:hypothetical protein